LKKKGKSTSKAAKKTEFKKLGVIMVSIILVGASIFYFYSAEQAQIRGLNFGNELQYIQDELKNEQSEFYSKVSMWKEKSISKEQIMNYANIHLVKMNDIIAKYTELQMPDAFSGSVKLFKLSTETQLESDKHLINWIENGDETEKKRAEELLQASFEYEMGALSSFEKAKSNLNP
jgi:hypothetical protein